MRGNRIKNINIIYRDRIYRNKRHISGCLTHLKRLWCWERLKTGGEGDDRGWDGWMASRTRWTWVWVNSGSWWWTGRPGVLQSMASQRVGHDWATELNWTSILNGKGHGSPVQCSCLENPMDRGAWRATLYNVSELDLIEWLSTLTLS